MRLAAEHGSDLVEVDLRLTADDVPVIAHDSDLSRVFGVNRLIKDVTLDELRALTPPDREPLLTLEELIEVCKPLRIGLYLDIKASSATGLERALDTLKRHHMLRSVVFASFRADWVAEVKALQPDAITSILFSSVHVEPVGLAGALRADYVHPCWERLDAPHTFLTDDWLDNVRAAGLGVICWHEERPDEIAALQQLGVSGICSDQPDLLIPKA
jgi:glycerophosphoryl diester phosphodiesterase